MRHWRLVGALCGVLLLGGAGCGIPAESDVTVERRGVTATEAGSANGGGSEPPSPTASGTDNEAFVRNFLAAPAGDADRAHERVKQFVAPEHRARLEVKKGGEVGLTVVRLRDQPVFTGNSDSTTTVRIAVQQIGVLRANGTLVPPVATETEYKFRLRSAAPSGAGDDDRTGLYVLDPPKVLLLSDAALQQYYRDAPIYFWNSDRTQLVPDQRYLPLAVPKERRVNEVVKWLVGGPSDWLRPGVVGLPERTEMINNATGVDGRWEVNLDMPGDDQDRIDQLITQIAHSLGDLPGVLELKIRNNPQPVQDLIERRRSEQLYQIPDSPQRFCVYDGSIHPLAFAGEAGGTVPLAAEVNRNVVSAGIGRKSNGEIFAALVRTASKGRQRLAVGTGTDPVAVFNQGRSEFTSISRPVWLRAADSRLAQGLVVADGRLYRFDQSGRTDPVSLNLPSAAVTAVATSLDGQRVALVAGGRLYVAAVNRDGGGVSIGPPRQLVTSLTALTAVDWVQENRLVVAGTAGQPAIYEIGVDGALETPLKTDVGAKVNHLSAYPSNPTALLPSAAFMYDANGVAYRSSPFDRIQPDQVRQTAPPANGARPGNPSAPFFIY
ncbi:LpqB family beta-propeller domain-containing protein [Micromonospora sp. GCM10011542]|uniref:LpqB family beta-propeller domain-containing protein n=1 Tax=Micromonospora sp. GCM10011542 TaxID=3317337 RepID=UPI0036096925